MSARETQREVNAGWVAVKSLAMLIARLEMAAKGSRELDEAIATYLWGEPKPTGNIGSERTLVWWQNGIGRSVAPEFTESLDAALTLVPAGMRVRELGQWWDIDRPGGWFCAIMAWQRVGVALVEDTYSFGVPDDENNKMPPTAPTPALALCIAALKARAA